MDRRTEPRFQVSSPARVIPLDHPERELPGSLVNISASGLLLLVDESLAVGCSIVIEVEHHLILGEVQNSQARGSKFAVGTKRLHALERLELPPDATAAENIQTLMNDFQRLTRDAEPSRSAQPVEVSKPASEVSSEKAAPSIPAPVPVWPKLPSPSLAQFAAIRGALDFLDQARQRNPPGN